MNRQVVAWALFLLFAAAPARRADGQQVLVNLTPETIGEAIQLAADEKAAGKFLQSYVVQARSGLGSGPLIGYCSTPFARVVLAALAARKEGKVLASSDVRPDLLAPELQVVVVSQPAAYDPVAATVEGVIIAPRNATADAAIQPLSIAPATAQHYALYSVAPRNGAIVASFPLSAVAAGNALRVMFSHVVRGSSALTNCQECVVPFAAARIK